MIFTAYVAGIKILYKAVLKKYGNEHNDDKNFSVSSMYTQHTGSRWYTPDIHIDTTNIYASAPTLHQGLYISAKSVPSICRQEETACFILPAVIISICTFIWCAKRWKISSVREGMLVKKVLSLLAFVP